MLPAEMDKTGHWQSSLSLLSRINPECLQPVIECFHCLKYFSAKFGSWENPISLVMYFRMHF
jgi:hypothetical protein